VTAGPLATPGPATAGSAAGPAVGSAAAGSAAGSAAAGSAAGPVLAPRLWEVMDLVRTAPDGGVLVDGRPVPAGEDRVLRHGVSAALYRTAHAGLAGDPVDPGPRRAEHRRDLARERELIAALPHRERAEPVRVLRRGPGSVLVLLDGLRVAVAADALTGPDDAPAVRMPTARPALSPGFLLADGSRGSGATGPDLLRLYAHVPDPQAGLVLWRTAARVLEEHGVPFRMKTTSAVTDVARRDGLVVYLGPAALPALGGLVDALAATGAAGAATSPFARELAPGLAVAWDPRDPRPGMRGLSFGQHRCLVVAAALLTPDGRADPAAAVHDALVAAGVDPRHPHRALDGPAAP
jgi:hypothetical protein